MKNCLQVLGRAACLLTFSAGSFLIACNGDSDSAGPTAASITVTALPVSVTGLPINSRLSASFNQEMDAASVNATTFTVKSPDGAAVTGVVTYVAASKVAIFAPASNLAPSTVYTATISTGVKNPAGKALAAAFVWTVTTGATSDTTPPTAAVSNPTVSSVDVPINRELSVIFGEAMDPSTLNSTTFTLAGPDGGKVLGTVTYAGTTATFTPKNLLTPDTTYTATVTTGVTDLAGNALASAFVFTFTTGSTSAKGPSPVALGTAGQFVILAKTAVSTTGVTAVVGDIGISPAAQSYATGFSETLDSTNNFATAGVVTGKIYAADMAVPTPSNLTTAVSCMETAYTDAAGRVLPDFTELGAGDVSGQTLTPGLYKWGTGLLMTSDVTLSGGQYDVWIFQIAQDVTVSNGVAITLAGGARPENIFWQVAGQVTLGTTSAFKGIVLSQTQIVLQTGAVLNGRALAQTAVTLDANAVTQPAK